MSGSLHILGTGALLWALGGFADEAQYNSAGRYYRYTPADIDLIRSFYRRFSRRDGRLEDGKAQALADLLGRDPIALRASMCQMRRRGALPPLCREAA